jgi:2-hydroxychromene-2-carboxylate isomerase
LWGFGHHAWWRPAASSHLHPRANTDEAVRLGIFGAPNFLVGGELFFGQDRLDDAIAWAKTAPSK